MKFRIEKYSDALLEDWEKLNLNVKNSSFLSSIHWLNFKKKRGANIDLYLVYLNERIVGLLPIEIFRRKIAKYAYSAYSPVLDLVDEDLEDFYKSFKRFCNEYIKKNSLNLFRFDPLLDVSKRPLLEKLEYKKSLSPAQAIDTWVMDISGEEEELFMKIKKDTRYYIRRAEKNGIKIVKASNKDKVAEFGELMKETTLRKGFGNYNSEYYIDQWNELSSKGLCSIYLAKFEDKAISGALINHYKDTANYSHGASTSDYELMKLSSPYLLHWEIIKDMRSKDINKYNFWGVLPDNVSKSHNMYGLSMFKKKFPGELVSYVGAYEFAPGLKGLINRVSDYFSYKKERY
ncbi:MAG: peptidoglycan bridge formation glycyltransferase FemA/FemB family protein [Candidatus Dojkabacteria bacterium]|nr:peptidoglycan bridge formation glycyltransferase FemA/FemB family protein [Candidatus Dojkabacteria bacterium]MDQ7020599.1 peptidoglycan bridge formation glycyltransferase FemA/FemB family protein [Candidatus Dojkabacteria bacterium]